MAYYAKFKPTRPGKLDPTASFFVQASGNGNPGSYEFSLVVLHYSGRRKQGLNVRLPQMEGCYTNSYTTSFPVTEEVLLKFVQDRDDFPNGEAAAITEQLWTVLHNLVDHNNMPTMVYNEWNQLVPRITYWVPVRNIYLATVALCVAILLGASFLLARWYCRFLQNQRDPNVSEPNLEGREACASAAPALPNQSGPEARD
jgi:hypothetical protein